MQQLSPEISEIFTLEMAKKLSVPLYGYPVQAGFPSPAEDFIEAAIDLNEILIQNPAATYMVRVAGLSMIGAGIAPGDVLIVDRSLDYTNQNIVIAEVDGDMTVKRYVKDNKGERLVAENPEYADILFSDSNLIVHWGVVTFCLKGFACDSSSRLQ